jgi:hypothetical protein
LEHCFEIVPQIKIRAQHTLYPLRPHVTVTA